MRELVKTLCDKSDVSSMRAFSREGQWDLVISDTQVFVSGSIRERMCVAVCCSVLQCVAVWCSGLQCVAVCCSVLQCVAVCRSVSQCVAVLCLRTGWLGFFSSIHSRVSFVKTPISIGLFYTRDIFV